MNLRGFFIVAFSLAGPLIAPALAQLVHVSVNARDPYLLFKADTTGIRWDQSLGMVTQLDFTYDSHFKEGSINPTKNYWHMRVENPSLRNFEIVRPFTSIFVGDQSVRFTSSRVAPGILENMEIHLFFDTPLSPVGQLPLSPLPALGSTEYSVSSFYLIGTRTMFDVPNLAEAYGRHDIRSITTSMTVIPEPSTYALAGLAIIGVALGLRRYAEHRKLLNAA